MSLEDNELDQLARELHEEWESPSLWPRIDAALRNERPKRNHAQTWQLALAVAAILILTVALSQLMPRQTPQPANSDFLTQETFRLTQRILPREHYVCGVKDREAAMVVST